MCNRDLPTLRYGIFKNYNILSKTIYFLNFLFDASLNLSCSIRDRSFEKMFVVQKLCGPEDDK